LGSDSIVFDSERVPVDWRGADDRLLAWRRAHSTGNDVDVRHIQRQLSENGDGDRLESAGAGVFHKLTFVGHHALHDVDRGAASIPTGSIDAS
jgi:hypothetical protein